MFFQGIFISILSFSIIIVCQPLISRAEFHFSHRIWPAFLGLGVLLLLLSLWICYLWLSVIFCSAALTFPSLYISTRPVNKTPGSDDCIF